MFSKDAITNIILAYIIRKWTYVSRNSEGVVQPLMSLWCLSRILITTTQILLPPLNFNGQSLKLPDECGPTISDHTKQHCRNKRSMITPEAWIPVIINSQCLNKLSALRNTFYPEYKYVYVCLRMFCDRFFILLCALGTPYANWSARYLPKKCGNAAMPRSGKNSVVFE